MDSYKVDDGDDDWFYESIRRYNTLQMFDLQNMPEHVVQMQQDSVCVAGRYEKGNNSELLQLKLPKKLTLPTEDEGRSKGNDFKMLSGVFTGACVTQLGQIRNTAKVVTAEVGQRGLQLYDLDSEGESSMGNASKFCNAEITSPTFAIDQEQMIISKLASNDVLLVCVETGNTLKTIKNPFHGNMATPCQFCSHDEIAIINSTKGDIMLYDLRTDAEFSHCVNVKAEDNDSWVLSSCSDEFSSPHFGVLSNKGSCIVHDRRSSKCLLESSLGFSTAQARHLKMKMLSNLRVSISGFDPNVYVFSIQNEFVPVFTHNGHTKMSCGSENNITTDHIWVQNVSENCFLSACDNSTLNCWDYVNKK